LAGNIITSFGQHISDTKHGLPGVEPFSAYATQWLLLDRMFAYMSGAVVLFEMFIVRPYMTDAYWYAILAYGLSGVIVVVISERWITDDLFWYRVLHSEWHIVAYSMFWIVCGRKAQFRLYHYRQVLEFLLLN